jgi:lactoylglutathione lyase
MEPMPIPDPPPNDWAKRVFAITLFQDDLAEARRFYADVFGMPILDEGETSVAFRFPGLIVNLLAVGSAPELIDPAPVGARGTPARMMLTLQVDDVDAVAERLRARDVELLNGPMDRPWGPRTVTFADPSGHCWELAS